MSELTRVLQAMADDSMGMEIGDRAELSRAVKEIKRLTAEAKRMRSALERTVTLMVEMGTRSGQTISTAWVLGMAESALPYSERPVNSPKNADKYTE